MTEQEKKGINPNNVYCDGCKYYKSKIVQEPLPPYPYRKIESCVLFECSLTYKRRCTECLESYIKEEVNNSD